MQTKNQTTQQPNVTTEVAMHNCNYCGKVYKVLSSLKRHFKKDHKAALKQERRASREAFRKAQRVEKLAARADQPQALEEAEPVREFFTNAKLTVCESCGIPKQQRELWRGMTWGRSYLDGVLRFGLPLSGMQIDGPLCFKCGTAAANDHLRRLLVELKGVVMDVRKRTGLAKWAIRKLRDDKVTFNADDWKEGPAPIKRPKFESVKGLREAKNAQCKSTHGKDARKVAQERKRSEYDRMSALLNARKDGDVAFEAMINELGLRDQQS